MNETGSVTHWLDQLRSGDADERNRAAEEIWRRHAHQLLALARHNLAQRLRRRVDEDDVLQSTYKSFCLRQQRGEFDLAGRDELWQLLATITLRKIRNLVERHGRQRRDYRREQTEGGGDEVPDAIAALPADAPTPEEVAVLNEELQRRLRGLPEELRQLALWKLAGYSNEEIAGPQMLDCSLRTVERKLERIRGKWLAHDDPSSTEGDAPEPPPTPEPP